MTDKLDFEIYGFDFNSLNPNAHPSFRVDGISEPFRAYGIDHFLIIKLKKACQQIDLLRAEVDFLKEREAIMSSTEYRVNIE